MISAALDALAHDRLGPRQRVDAERAAHMIAGAGGTFGFPRATQLARELEHGLVHAGSADADRLASLLADLRAELGRA